MKNMRRWLVMIAMLLTAQVSAMEKPEDVVYCFGKTLVEFTFDRTSQNNDVLLTINGETKKYMTAYSWFGSVQPAPQGFKFAILGEGLFDPLLVFDNHLEDANQNKYVKCN